MSWRGAALLLSFLTFGCGEQDHSDTQEQWNEGSKASVIEALDTEKSVQFRRVEFYRGAGPVTCGQVRVAGQESFQRFVAYGSLDATLESAVEDGLMDQIWAASCVK